MRRVNGGVDTQRLRPQPAPISLVGLVASGTAMALLTRNRGTSP